MARYIHNAKRGPRSEFLDEPSSEDEGRGVFRFRSGCAIKRRFQSVNAVKNRGHVRNGTYRPAPEPNQVYHTLVPAVNGRRQGIDGFRRHRAFLENVAMPVIRIDRPHQGSTCAAATLALTIEDARRTSYVLSIVRVRRIDRCGRRCPGRISAPTRITPRIVSKDLGVRTIGFIIVR